MDIEELKQRLMRQRKLAVRVLAVGLFAAAGWLAVQGSSAATYAVTMEAEAGTTDAYVTTEAGASGGSLVRFQPAPPPPPPTPPPAGGTDYSLRFFGTQTNDIDRVKIPLTPNKSIDVGGSFTLEWWMKTAAGNDLTQNCRSGNNVDWIFGNIIWDRDTDGQPDAGDYGISVFGDGRLAFGVENGNGAMTICSTAAVGDGQWHHVAATRNTASGQLCLYIDGTQRGCGNGPAGDIAYRDGRSTAQPDSDPFLVIGAEKHDYWTFDTGYHGWVDEARLSGAIRYTANFSRPAAPFSTDASTVALYHFDSGNGTTAVDATGANNGVLRVGGANNGPQWSTDTPL
jgi:hypothetical protein